MNTMILGSLGLLLALEAMLPAPVAFMTTRPVAPCTTFCLPGPEGPVFGRNYDWQIGVGLVIVNKRDLVKRALINTPGTPAEWTSKLGSITFNQYGRELPMGGINEAGLVVEQMWLQGTRYPAPDERPALRELAWIQYQLDTCLSVEEVVATDKALRITADSAPLHFLVCDRSGDVAAVEFLEGEMVVHRGSSAPVPALANSSYADSLEYLEVCEGFGGDRSISRSTSSLDRFARAACGVAEYTSAPAQETVAYAFGILADVSQGPATQWSIVYDIHGLAVHFRTSKSSALKTLKLGDLDFSPQTPCLILDIDQDQPGDARERLVEYSTEANRKLVFESWKKTAFLADTPDEVLNALAEYPESIVANAPKRAGG